MGDTGSYLELLQEIQSLRETVDELKQTIGKCHRVTLRPVHVSPFLGQPVTVVATVTDASGRTPKGDARMTFSASWGKLRCSDGFSAQEARTVTARTGVDGTIRLTHLPDTSEELWDVQSSALESMLRRLDPTVPTPQEDLKGFLELARQYRWEANVHFRRAVDIYVRDFQRRAMETVNTHDHMARWRYLDATVVAYVRDDEAADNVPSSVWGTAALTLQFKDWLGPLLQAHLDLASAESRLDRDLVWIKDLEKDTGRLVETVYDRIRDYVNGQRGLLGEIAGRKVSQAAIGGFLQASIGDLPLEARASLFAPLQAASGTLEKAGVSVLSGLGQARTELKKDLSTAVNQIETTNLGPMRDQLSGIESQLLDKPGRTELSSALAGKADLSALEGFRRETEGSLKGKADVTALEGLRTETKTALGLKADASALSTFQSKMESSLATKADLMNLQNLAAAVNENLRLIGDRIGGVERQVQEKVGKTELAQAMATKVDRATFDSYRTELNTALGTKVDNVTFERFQLDVNDRLNKKVGTDVFDAGMSRTNAALAGKADKTALETLRSSMEQSLSTKVELTQFSQYQTEVKNALSTKAATSDLTQLQSDLTLALRSKVDTATFKVFSTAVNESLQTKVDTVTFSRFQSDVNSRLRVVRPA